MSPVYNAVDAGPSISKLITYLGGNLSRSNSRSNMKSLEGGSSSSWGSDYAGLSVSAHGLSVSSHGVHPPARASSVGGSTHSTHDAEGQEVRFLVPLASFQGRVRPTTGSGP